MTDKQTTISTITSSSAVLVPRAAGDSFLTVRWNGKHQEPGKFMWSLRSVATKTGGGRTTAAVYFDWHLWPHFTVRLPRRMGIFFSDAAVTWFRWREKSRA